VVIANIAVGWLDLLQTFIVQLQTECRNILKLQLGGRWYCTIADQVAGKYCHGLQPSGSICNHANWMAIHYEYPKLGLRV